MGDEMERKIAEMQEIIAQLRHANASMLARLTEMEDLASKVCIGPTGNLWFTIPDPPPKLVELNPPVS